MIDTKLKYHSIIFRLVKKKIKERKDMKYMMIDLGYYILQIINVIFNQYFNQI